VTWDQLEHTRRCVESIRSYTDVPYELIIVDNGSREDGVNYARTAADHAILNGTNRGFACAMNQGLSVARGDYVAFVNNDTAMPPAWASTLLKDFDTHANAGIVAPAVTAAGNPCTVRSEPGTEVELLLPFGEFPSGVVYVMQTAVARALGGWSEEYPVASAEDLDLSFKVWANNLAILLDERVLVDHASQVTVRAKLADHKTLYRQNLELFVRKWGADGARVPRLPECDQSDFERNLQRARTAVQWIERMLQARSELQEARRRVQQLERQLTRERESPRRRQRPVRSVLRPLIGKVRRRVLR
jgi:O-antigen biosynthesis protein